MPITSLSKCKVVKPSVRFEFALQFDECSGPMRISIKFILGGHVLGPICIRCYDKFGDVNLICFVAGYRALGRFRVVEPVSCLGTSSCHRVVKP